MYSEIISQTYHAAHNISHIASDNFLIHSHDFYEFHYFIGGNIRYLFAGTEHAPKPHTLMIFPPNVFHGIHVTNTEAYERHTIHFTENLLPKEYRGLLMGSLPTEESLRSNAQTIPHMIENADQLEVLPIFQEYQKLTDAPDSLRDCMVGTLTQLLLGKLLSFASRQAPLTVEYGWHAVSPELEAILNYINQNLTRKLSLDILTEHFFISKSKLNTLFHKRMNCTVMEYITRRRLNYAQQLLINGFSATQASSASGFGDYTSFYRAYSKHMGHSPASDMHPAPANASSYLFKDEKDDAAPSQTDKNDKPTIWDIHHFQSATAIDISALRDSRNSR